jgi:hypothetical protein
MQIRVLCGLTCLCGLTLQISPLRFDLQICFLCGLSLVEALFLRFDLADSLSGDVSSAIQPCGFNIFVMQL